MMVADWVLHQEEVPIIDKDDYYFALDEYRRGNDQMVFLHLVVHKWTPSVFKEILRNWKLFRECVTCPLFASAGYAVDADDVAKWERFVSRLGFKFLMPVVCENGVERRLFVHHKEEQQEQNVSQFVDQQQYDHKQQHDGDVHHEPVVDANPVSDAGVPERG